MANDSIAKAYVQLSVSGEGISEDISKALGGSGSKEGTNFGTTFLKGAGAVISAGASVIGGTIATLWNTATATASAGDEIDKMSKNIGISRDAYQEWGYVMQLAGGDVNSLQASMKTLSSVITDATAGGKEASAKLDAIGLSAEQLVGLNLEDQLSLVVAQLQGMEQGAERTAYATDLLGRSATSMGALFEMTAEEVENAKNKAHDYGMVLSDEAVTSSAMFQDSLTTLQNTASGLGKSLTATMLPSLTQVMDGISMLFAGESGADEVIANGVNAMVESFSSLIPKFTRIITQLAGPLLSGASDLIISLADAMLGAIPQLLPVLSSIMSKLASSMLVLMPKFLEVGMGILIAMVQGIGNLAPTLIPEIVSTITDMMTILFSNADTLVDVAVVMIQGLSDGIITAIPILLEALPTVIGAFYSFFENSYASVLEIITIILQLIAKAIPLVINTLVKIMPEIVVAIANALTSSGPEIAVAFVELFLTFLSVLPQIEADIISQMPTVISAFVEGFKNGWPEIQESAMNSFAVMMNGFYNSENLKNLKENIDRIIQSFKDNFGAKFEEFKSIGSNIIQGLIDGIKGMWSSVVGTVSDIANGISDAFKNFFGIHSPSKLFYSYGEFLDEGLADGINASADVVGDAMNGLATDMNSNISTEVTSVPSNATYRTSGSYSAKDEVVRLLAQYLPIIADKDAVIEINADADGMFEMVRRQNQIFKKSNGYSAFA